MTKENREESIFNLSITCLINGMHFCITVNCGDFSERTVHQDQALFGDHRQEITLFVSLLDISHCLSRRHVSQSSLSDNVLFAHAITYAMIQDIIVLIALHL